MDKSSVTKLIKSIPIRVYFKNKNHAHNYGKFEFTNSKIKNLRSFLSGIKKFVNISFQTKEINRQFISTMERLPDRCSRNNQYLIICNRKAIFY
jgi:hypothetical protein